MVSRSIGVAAILISAYIIIQFLWYSQSILIPFIFAILIWNLLRTIARSIQNFPLVGSFIPNGISILIACGVIGVFFMLIGLILSENMQGMMGSLGKFQDNLSILLKKLPAFGIDKNYIVNLSEKVLKQLNFQHIFLGFYSSFTNLMSSLFLVMLFVLFFFIEQVFFHEKMSKLFSNSKTKVKVENLLNKISVEIQRYLGLKTLFSVFTGVSLYIVFKWMDLEFAAFWGVCIFLLNFIPNIGPFLITILISLFAYFQWLDLSKLTLIFGVQVVVHAFIGNFLEPHYLGKTMHLSPLFILMALSFWGILWGGTGLFLAVPMTVLMMIVMSSFEATRFWAILMSENGDLPDEA